MIGFIGSCLNICLWFGLRSCDPGTSYSVMVVDISLTLEPISMP